MRKLIFLIIFLPIFSYSQKTDVLARASMRYLKGVSLGLLVQGQTKYPSPYYGPEVKGLYNDGAYHFIADVYIGDLLIGFQLTDEYLYLEKTDSNGGMWKPRGFNNSYSSLTRSYWVSLGYNVYDNFNLKTSIGFRNGPVESILLKNLYSSEIATGFDYTDPSIIYNQSTNFSDKYSEIDFSLSINYLFQIHENFGVLPELGYSFKHGGIISGVGIMFINQLYE